MRSRKLVRGPASSDEEECRRDQVAPDRIVFRQPYVFPFPPGTRSVRSSTQIPVNGWLPTVGLRASSAASTR